MGGGGGGAGGGYSEGINGGGGGGSGALVWNFPLGVTGGTILTIQVGDGGTGEKRDWVEMWG